MGSRQEYNVLSGVRSRNGKNRTLYIAFHRGDEPLTNAKREILCFQITTRGCTGMKSDTLRALFCSFPLHYDGPIELWQDGLEMPLMNS